MADKIVKKKTSTNKRGGTRTVTKSVSSGGRKTRTVVKETPKGKYKKRVVSKTPRSLMEKDGKGVSRSVSTRKYKPGRKYKTTSRLEGNTSKVKEITRGKKNTLVKTKTRMGKKDTSGNRKIVSKGRVGDENAGNRKYRIKLKRKK